MFHSDRAPLRRNIELKARLDSWEFAHELACRIATSAPERLSQRDTYFHCRHGRLKLREIACHAAQLVWYERRNDNGPKQSDYRLVAVEDPPSLLAALTEALGVLVVVEKERHIFLWHNVRIHLDRVTDLGSFLEFEAVVQPDVDDARALRQVLDLQAQFRLAPDDLVSRSYSDLLLDARSAATRPG